MRFLVPRAAFSGCHSTGFCHLLASSNWRDTTTHWRAHRETQPSQTALIQGHKLAAVLDSEEKWTHGPEMGCLCAEHKKIRTQTRCAGTEGDMTGTVQQPNTSRRSERSDVPSSSSLLCHSIFFFFKEHDVLLPYLCGSCNKWLQIWKISGAETTDKPAGASSHVFILGQQTARSSSALKHPQCFPHLAPTSCKH